MLRPAARLPGVYVESERPLPADGLPRMDVAAFVGFAAAGPLHLPVAVEDLGRFRELYGPDLPLARDEARGGEQRSLLGPALEAFFANGGRRAWVVRVADESRAETLRTRVPGLARPDGTPAEAEARAPGLWPASLGLATRLARAPLSTAAQLAGSGTGPLSLDLGQSSAALAPGDLVEAAFDESGLLLLLVVERSERTGGRLVAHGRQAFWRRRPVASPDAQVRLGADDPALEAVSGHDEAVSDLFAGSPPPLADAAFRLTFELAAWEGERILGRLDGLGFAEQHPRFWAALPDDAALFAQEAGRPARRLTAAEERFRADAAAPRFPFAGPKEPAPLYLPDGMATTMRRERAVALDAPAGATRLEREGLAFPTAALFLDDRLVRTPVGALAGEMEARYAAAPRTDRGLRGLYSLLPVHEASMIAVPDAVHRAWTRALLEEERTELAAPFLYPLPDRLDPFSRLALAWTAVEGAARYRIETAEEPGFAGARATFVTDTPASLPVETGCPAPLAVRVRAERGGEVGPWSNARLALLPAEDFALCGVPEPDRLTLMLQVETVPRLAWGYEFPASAAAGDSFELEAATSAAMADAVPVVLADPSARRHMPPPPAAGEVHFRVRLRRGGTVGPWSQAARISAGVPASWTLGPPPSALARGIEQPDRLALTLWVEAVPRLVWSYEDPSAAAPEDQFELESGASPTMEDATAVALADPFAPHHLPDRILEGSRYFRVRVQRGAAVGPWSATVRVTPEGRSDWVFEPEGDYRDDAVVAVHRALIRFCAARGDAVALLSLPRHYDEARTARHLGRLSPLIAAEEADDAAAAAEGVPALRLGEEGALSHAALYHPWLAIDSGTSAAFQTPEGPAAGLLAQRALNEGAWIAAANLPIARAMALDPALADEAVARLIALQVNPLVREPRGFLFFNAETLSALDDYRPLAVRRLMILLRRLALREGGAYVFEPHDADFRALVRRRFERLLSLVHERGGLAGPTPEASFRVLAEDSVNPPGAVELGRFTVELRVAPSRPFRYLNIRLLQAGPERLSVEEA